MKNASLPYKAATYNLKIVQVYAPTTSYLEEDVNRLYNDVARETKPLHDSDGRLLCVNREKNKSYGNSNREMWPRIEKRKRRHLGNIKKVQIHEYHVSEESREEMDKEKPKLCNE